MAKLNICSNFLTITSHQEFFAFSLDTIKNVLKYEKIVTCSDNNQDSNDISIECSVFSPCEKYFGVCFDRNIIIYNTNNWNILYNSLTERKACSLQFFPKSKIVLLADKSGCAVFYSFKENNLEKTQLVLGHNSMLTSALVTENERFIVTCDRDEKIRITSYPSVYDIKSYCLGHKMFVSCIQFLPSDKRILISSSGDGTIRLWHYTSGKELALYDCNDVNNMNQNSKTTITKFVSCKQNNMSVVALLEYKSNQIKVLNIKGDLIEGFIIEFVEVLKLDSIPWDIAFYNEILICLLCNNEKPLIFWSSVEINKTKLKEYFKNVTESLTDNWDFIVNSTFKISDVIPVLFKREMDNLQEYEQRKKARLLRTGKTS